MAGQGRIGRLGQGVLALVAACCLAVPLEGSPPEAVAALKQAFVSLPRDEEFLADAKKVMRFTPRFETGEEADRLYQKVMQAPAEVLDFLRKFIDQVKK